jgi:H+-translocating NAD(P) transhydrogenase
MLYSNNITIFLLSIGGNAKFSIDLNDKAVRVVHQGRILPPAPRPTPLSVAPPVARVEEKVTAITPWQKASREVAIIGRNG